ncbi:MAG: hypothetical protein K6T91_07360 [Firmicutes bacterium]|nr:hypothetical protein [Bacillota bacterium]
MSEIEVGLKRFVKYICCFYLAMPDPAASGRIAVRYARKLQASVKAIHRFRLQSETDKTIA